MTLNYGKAEPTNKSATPVFDGIVIENVYCGKGGSSYFLEGLPEQKMLNVTFKNITMGAGVGGEAACDAIECRCIDSASCPSCCTGVHPPSPSPPPPPVPPAKPGCVVSSRVGCYNNSDGPTVLKIEKLEYHDRVTLENCAGLCAASGMPLAGVDGGNHCWCGPEGAAPSSPAATKHAVPMDQCVLASCPGKYGDHCSCTGNPTERCGAVGRLLVYNYTHC